MKIEIKFVLSQFQNTRLQLWYQLIELIIKNYLLCNLTTYCAISCLAAILINLIKHNQ